MIATAEEQRARHSRLRAWFVALGSFLFLWMVCAVPYHVPARPVVSESYAFGYNNRAAQVIVAVWLMLLAFFGPSLRLADVNGKPLRRSTLRKALVIIGAFALVLYLATRQLNGFGESVYFLDRLHLVLHGKVPYRDFEYIYGAGLLYVPALLVWVFHLPPGDAYGLFWIGTWLLGIWLLFLTLHSVRELRGSQRAIFLLFCANSLVSVSCVGLNYSILRFILACWLATFIHRRLASDERMNGISALLLPVPAYVLLLLVSPELALAFAIGISAYLLVFGGLSTTHRTLAYVGGVLGLVAVTLAAWKLGVFQSLAGFGAGGYNFPLMPAPHLLLLFLFAGLCALYVGQQVRSRQGNVLVAVIAVSAVSLAAALGRADPAHTGLNPLGIVLGGFFLLSGYPWLRRLVFAFSWLTFLLVLPLFYRDMPAVIAKADLPIFFAHEYAKIGSEQMTPRDNAILARMTRTLGPEDARLKFDERRFYARILADQNHRPMDVPAIFGLPPGTVFYAPFAFSPDRSGTYDSPSVEEGYFAGIMNITTPEQVQRKTRELLAEPRRPLLLPPDFEASCHDYGAGSTFLIRSLFRYPYNHTIVHPESVLKPFCGALHANFHPAGASIPEHFGYLLWMPNA